MPTVDARHARLYYEASGRPDGEPLLLSNSLGSSMEMWNRVLPVLEKEFRVVRYDTRGHGRSSVPAAPYTIEQLGCDALAVLDAVGISRASFCGLSLGGLTGQWLAVHAPERIRRLILANTAARIGTEAMWDARMESVRESGMKPIAAATPERWFTGAYRERFPEQMEQIRRMVAGTEAEGYIGCCAVLRDADLRASTCAIAHMCLVVAGRDDPATPPADVRALYTALPSARYVELGSSHLSAWECGAEFAEAVLAFLQEGSGHG